MNLKLPFIKNYNIENSHFLALAGNTCNQLWLSMKKSIVYSFSFSENGLTQSPLGKYFHCAQAMATGQNRDYKIELLTKMFNKST